MRNAGPINDSPKYNVPSKRAEYDAFDALPKELRDGLNNAAFAFSALETKQLLEEGVPLRVIAVQIQIAGSFYHKKVYDDLTG